MKNLTLRFILLATIVSFTITISAAASSAKTPPRQFYQLIIYHMKNKAQLSLTDQYLGNAYLPAVHRAGIKTAGVFKNVNIDTAADKKIYVLLVFKSLEEFHQLTTILNSDKELATKGGDYLEAAFDKAPYTRKESVLMEAFAVMPVLKKPEFTNPKNERIYELRSYESATENLYRNKVHMFNEGKETEIFTRIGSGPVFYAEVLSGADMPNLMYMTSYSNMKSRDEHWKTFGDDPEWKKISGLPAYQHNVSKADIDFLSPTDYSDL